VKLYYSLLVEGATTIFVGGSDVVDVSGGFAGYGCPLGWLLVGAATESTFVVVAG